MDKPKSEPVHKALEKPLAALMAEELQVPGGEFTLLALGGSRSRGYMLDSACEKVRW